jgi:hypothetical protein
MAPKVRFLDGVVCVLLSRGALSLQVACSAPKASNLPDLQRRADAPNEGGDSIKGLQLQLQSKGLQLQLCLPPRRQQGLDRRAVHSVPDLQKRRDRSDEGGD